MPSMQWFTVQQCRLVFCPSVVTNWLGSLWCNWDRVSCSLKDFLSTGWPTFHNHRSCPYCPVWPCMVVCLQHTAGKATSKSCPRMECVTFPPLSRVAICGGTHGNEWTGVYMVREVLRQNVERDGSTSLTVVLSNPPAVEACRRYIDMDLNRCFTSSLLRWV